MYKCIYLYGYNVYNLILFIFTTYFLISQGIIPRIFFTSSYYLRMYLFANVFTCYRFMHTCSVMPSILLPHSAKFIIHTTPCSDTSPIFTRKHCVIVWTLWAENCEEKYFCPTFCNWDVHLSAEFSLHQNSALTFRHQIDITTHQILLSRN